MSLAHVLHTSWHPIVHPIANPIAHPIAHPLAHYYLSFHYALQNFICSPFSVLSGCFLLLLHQPYNKPFGICCGCENSCIGLCGREFTILDQLFA